MDVSAADVLKLIGTGFGAYLLYLGVQFTAKRSKEGVERTAEVDEQQSALDAWKELVQPYRDEVLQLRRDLNEERRARQEKERADEKDRAEAKQTVDRQIERLTERIDMQAKQIAEWKRVARVIARWATTMRDEILRLNGTLPATPEELLTLQAIEDAEQS